MVQHAHKKDVIELTRYPIHVVDGAFLELDIQAQCASSEATLVKITIVNINSEYSLGPSALHVDGIEAPITADIQYVRSVKIIGNRLAYVLPLNIWEVSQEMFRGSRNSE